MKIDFLKSCVTLELIESYFEGDFLTVGLWRVKDPILGICCHGVIDYVTKKSLDCLDINHATHIYNLCIERHKMEGGLLNEKN